MKQLKKTTFLFTVMLTLLFAVSLNCVASEYMQSGDLSVEKPTKEQLKSVWDTLTVSKKDKYTFTYTDESEIYSVYPSDSAPYEAGELRSEFLQDGIDYLNFVRYASGVPATVLDEELNFNAQHGAVLISANACLSHTPSRPYDMESDFYSIGYRSALSSNIGYGHTSIYEMVQGCMDDLGSLQNLSTVGHRRWFLNPTLHKVGFGFCKAYTVAQVFDDSGNQIDYDFISYPASGIFPSNLLSAMASWSVTVNPVKYMIDMENIRVTVRNTVSNEEFVFDKNTPGPDGSGSAYFTVDTNGYGVSNCIIFSFGEDYYYKDDEIYTVKIEGLVSKSTYEETEINYQVEFFDAYECLEHNFVEKVYEADCENDGKKVLECTECGKQAGESTIIPAKGHKSDNGTLMSDYTGSFKLYKCKVCGCHLRTEYVDSQGDGKTETNNKKRLPAVTGLKAKKVKTTSLTLEWNKVKGADYYIVYYDIQNSGYFYSFVTGNSFFLNYLEPGADCKFMVIACSDTLYDSAESKVLRTSTKPAKTYVSSLKSPKKKRITLIWNGGYGADGFEVLCSRSKKFNDDTTKKVTVKNAAKTKVTVKKLKSKKKYFVKVRAYKTIGGKKVYGAYSKVKSIRVR